MPLQASLDKHLFMSVTIAMLLKLNVIINIFMMYIISFAREQKKHLLLAIIDLANGKKV
jgi:hypothetical protein